MPWEKYLEEHRGVKFDKLTPAREFIMPSYPGLGRIETRIWTRFLETTDMEFLQIRYNVKVGPGDVPEWAIDPTMRRMLYCLTALKIDAVAEDDKHYWIFEIKPRAGRSALGQLLSYAYWTVRQFNPKKPIKLGVVCVEVDRNMIEIFEERGIYIFKVRV